MPEFDHLTLPVADWKQSRDWYVQRHEMKVEFELPDRHTVALQDENLFTIFLQQSEGSTRPNGIALYFKVRDVESLYSRLAGGAGLLFNHAPQRVFWGYGVELADPDGYLVRLWDERTMKEKGS